LLANTLLVAQQRVASSASPTEGNAVLARRITVQLDGAGLQQALAIIGKSADVRIQYQYQLIADNDHRVTLRVTQLPLGAALEMVLKGTSISIGPITTAGVITLVRTPARQDAAAVADSIIGTVTDARTKRPMRGVSVALDDSIRLVRTDEMGRYRFADIKTGTHKISARFVGFARQVRLVTVEDGRTATVNFALESGVNMLDQVVVTATGEQRVRELGHVVAQINADSLVKEAPITDMGELLQSRIPGLQVLTSNGGVAGAPIALRLRGQSSINLNSEPIVIVDGVRYKSNNQVRYNFDVESPDIRGNGEPSSPLNDLNVNDIATVEVVKGPSASTLYGPEASNGVIVITTKHGERGASKWHWYARPVTSDVPTHTIEQKGYQVWAHDPADSTRAQVPYACTLVYQYKYKSCVVDSITVAPTFYKDPSLTFIGKNKPTWQYGANAGGGNSALTYYFSGDYSSQDGAVQVPKFVQTAIEQQLGIPALSSAVRNPNTLQNIGVRGTVSANPSAKITLSASADYHQIEQHRLDLNFFNGYGGSPVLPPGTMSDTAVGNYVLNNYFRMTTALTTAVDRTNRWNGVVQATMQPTAWLSANGQVGLDLNGETGHTVLPGSLAIDNPGGFAQDDRRDALGRTITLGATAIARPGPLSLRTSGGVQYIYQNLDGLTVSASNLAPGSSSIGSAIDNKQLIPYWSETVALGVYGQETVGLKDRVFLDLGLRLDGSTRFGDAYHPTPLPKVGLSWIVSDEPALKDRIPYLNELRLRGAWGAATRYPTSGMIFGHVENFQVTLDNVTYNTFDRQMLANPDLRPERSREFEYGFDATVFSRAQVQLTWFTRKTLDELNYRANPTGLGPIWDNVASVAQHGFEASLTLPVIDASSMRADVQFNYTYNTSKLLSLGDAAPPAGIFPSGVGYPLDAEFGYHSLPVDTVGNTADGIIFPEEVHRDLPYHFLGVANPPHIYTATPTVALWNGSVRASTVFDRETGFLMHDNFLNTCASTMTCIAPFVPSTPIDLQAKFVGNSYSDFLSPGDFTRWREMNVTVAIPPRFLRIDPLHLRFASASISLQGRNLKLWTRFSGTDPESRSNPGVFGAEAGGIPQARAWSFRFDVTP